MAEQEWRRGPFTISTDRARLDLDFIHHFLSTSSYWAQGRSREVVRRSVENSISFGLYEGGRQIGFARVVTDRATFAWLADVFVSDEFRGHGLGKWLVETILGYDEFKTLRRWILGTRDAHELYRQFGFKEVANPQFYMERLNTETGADAPPREAGGDS